MPDSIDDAAPPLKLALGPELTIAQAADTHGLLLEALSSLDGRNLVFDLSGVSDFDSSAVQLLLATDRSMQERSATLTLQDPSAVVLAALNCYGLNAELKSIRMNAASDAGQELPCQ